MEQDTRFVFEWEKTRLDWNAAQGGYSRPGTGRGDLLPPLSSFFRWWHLLFALVALDPAVSFAMNPGLRTGLHVAVLVGGFALAYGILRLRIRLETPRFDASAPAWAHCELDSHGLVFSDYEGFIRATWAQLEAVDADDEYLVFWFDGARRVLMPLRAIPSDRRDAVLAQIGEWAQPGKGRERVLRPLESRERTHGVAPFFATDQMLVAPFADTDKGVRHDIVSGFGQVLATILPASALTLYLSHGRWWVYLVALFLYLVAVVFTVRITLRARAAAFRDFRAAVEPRSGVHYLGLMADGVLVRSPVDDFFVKWPSVDSVERTPDAIALRANGRRFAIIPRGDLHPSVPFEGLGDRLEQLWRTGRAA